MFTLHCSQSSQCLPCSQCSHCSQSSQCSPCSQCSELFTQSSNNVHTMFILLFPNLRHLPHPHPLRLWHLRRRWRTVGAAGCSWWGSLGWNSLPEPLRIRSRREGRSGRRAIGRSRADALPLFSTDLDFPQRSRLQSKIWNAVVVKHLYVSILFICL